MTVETKESPESLILHFAPNDVQRVVSERDAAAFINVSLPHLRRLRREHLAPDHVRLSERRLGYRISALINFLDARTVSNSGEAA